MARRSDHDARVGNRKGYQMKTNTAKEFEYKPEDLGDADYPGPAGAFVCPKCDDHMEQGRKPSVYFCPTCGYRFDLADDWQTA